MLPLLGGELTVPQVCRRVCRGTQDEVPAPERNGPERITHRHALLLRGLSQGSRLCTSTVTRLEVRAGAHESEKQVTDKLLSRFVNVDLETRTADRAGTLIAESSVNAPVLAPDAIIAATALVHDIPYLIGCSVWLALCFTNVVKKPLIPAPALHL